MPPPLLWIRDGRPAADLRRGLHLTTGVCRNCRASIVAEHGRTDWTHTDSVRRCRGPWGEAAGTFAHPDLSAGRARGGAR